MAIAKDKPAKVETKIVELEPREIILTLSEREAYAVALFMGVQNSISCGGLVETNAIYAALHNIGIKSYGDEQPFRFVDGRKTGQIEEVK